MKTNDLLSLPDEDLSRLAADLGIAFDHRKWIAPRYKLIEAILEKLQRPPLEAFPRDVLTLLA